MAGVAGDLPGRGLERAPDDVHAHALVVVARLDLIERADGIDQSSTAARQDAFLDRGAGRVHRVVDALLALLPLDLGRAADPDHRHAAGQLRPPTLTPLAR